jgi:hypothetical protein
MGELKLVAEEKKKLEDEVASLKAAMFPADTETASTRGLLNRADLVGEIQSLGGKLLDGAMFAFDNALEQVKALNSDVKLNT